MQNPSAPVVETRQGALSGLTDENVHLWCGIPYAAPPVGEWRWRSPRPPERWDGLREATAFSASSWQSSEYCQELGGGDPGQFGAQTASSMAGGDQNEGLAEVQGALEAILSPFFGQNGDGGG